MGGDGSVAEKHPSLGLAGSDPQFLVYRILAAAVQSVLLGGIGVGIGREVELGSGGKGTDADLFQFFGREIQEGPVGGVYGAAGVFHLVHPVVRAGRVVHEDGITIQGWNKLRGERPRSIGAAPICEFLGRRSQSAAKELKDVPERCILYGIGLGSLPHLKSAQAQQRTENTEEVSAILRCPGFWHHGGGHDTIFSNEIGRRHELPAIPGGSAEKRFVIT